MLHFSSGEQRTSVLHYNSLWLIPFKRREKEEEDSTRKGGEGVVTWGDKNILE